MAVEASPQGNAQVWNDVAYGQDPSVASGSGNGLARHFGLSLDPAEAIGQLAAGEVRDMDVGLADGIPFLVSASVAWDAALVDAYNAIPFRGVASYALAGVYA